MHKTNNLNDGYFGSGKLLNRDIKLYGKENFKKEILAFYDSEKDMINAEKFIVTEDFCSSKLTYNLCPGGYGGAIRKGATLNQEIKNKISKSVKLFYSSLESDERRKLFKYDQREKWSEEQKAKHKIIKQGYIWVTDGQKDKMIKKNQYEDFLINGWKRGRSHPPHNKKY